MSIVTIKASGLNSPINYEVGEERRKEREKEEEGRGGGGREERRNRERKSQIPLYAATLENHMALSTY